MRTRSGTTLPEVLVAAALLSLVALMVVQALLAGFTHSSKLETKHDSLQDFIVFREFFYRNVSQSMLDLSASNPAQVVYFLPYQRSTHQGLINEVSPGESTHWNQNKRHILTYEVRNGEGVLVHTTRVSGTVEGERVVWNLGEHAHDAIFEIDSKGVLKLVVGARDEPGLPRWERTLVVAARTFRT